MAACALAARAQALRRPGEYLGLFDWLVWGDLRQVQVLMLFGTHVVDIRVLRAQGLPPLEASAVHRVVATARTGTGRLLTPAGFGAGGVNHYVIGNASPAASAASPHEDLAVPAGSCARAAAARVHWLLLPTSATGECGPDCVEFWSGAGRSATGWQAIRTELAVHMESKKEDAAWQEIFRNCGEDIAAARPLPAPGRTVALAGAYASDAVLLPGLDTRPSPANLAKAASAVAWSSGSLASCGPPAALSSHQLPEASSPRIELEVAESLAPLPPPPEDPPPFEDPPPVLRVRSLQEWLAELSKERLAEVTRDYHSFKAAEEEHRQSHPRPKARRRIPARQRQATSYNYKVAVGFAYKEWRQTEGSSSPAPLKESAWQHGRSPALGHIARETKASRPNPTARRSRCGRRFSEGSKPRNAAKRRASRRRRGFGGARAVHYECGPVGLP